MRKKFTKKDSNPEILEKKEKQEGEGFDLHIQNVVISEIEVIESQVSPTVTFYQTKFAFLNITNQTQKNNISQY